LEPALASSSYSSRRLFRALNMNELSIDEITGSGGVSAEAFGCEELESPRLSVSKEGSLASFSALPSASVDGWIYLDLSTSIGSADALRRLSDALAQIALERQEFEDPACLPSALILGLGNLLMTPALMRKVISLVQPSVSLSHAVSLPVPHSLSIVSVIATAPQTQLAALSAGLIVSERFPDGLIQASRVGYVPSSLQAASFGDAQCLLDSQVPNEEGNLSSGCSSDVAVGVASPEQARALLGLSQDMPASDSALQQAAKQVEFVPERYDGASVALLSTAALDDTLSTQRVTQTLRSGHRVVSEGHLVIVGDVHAGSEVVAAGDIIIWGELRGVAHAGAPVNGRPVRRAATVRALKLEALQLRIGDLLARRPDRAHLLTEPSADAVLPHGVLPEWAGVRGDEIKLHAHSMNERF
jgi:hypothetical protein